MAGIGEELQRAREARGLTLHDVQVEIKIRERYLQALETEVFEEIPGEVYARGFLRSYARYLGLDPEPLLAQLPAAETVPLEPEAEVPHVQPLRPVGRTRRGARAQWPWVVLPLVFLALLLYFVGSRGNLLGTAPVGSNPKSHQGSSGGGQGAPGGGAPAGGGVGTPGGGSGPGNGSTTPPLVSAAPSQGPFGGPETNFTLAKGPIAATIVLTGRCYLYVVADGQSPQVSTVEPSGTYSYKAQQSIVIKLGYPAAAKLTINGQEIPTPDSLAQSYGVQVAGG